MRSGLIFDIKKFAVHDGPGIRTTIFFKGCQLDCWWCQNPEGKNPELEVISINGGQPAASKSAPIRKEVYGREVSVSELMDEIKKDEIFYEQSGGGVTFSGGEPMMQIDFLHELLGECKRYNYHTAVDTTGHAPFEDFGKIYNLVDLFLYDLKIMDDELHQKYTGVSNNLILENLKRLFQMEDKLEVRIPLIPDITDSEKNLEDILNFLAGQKYVPKVSLLPYNKLSEDKLRRFNLKSKLGELGRQSKEEIEKIGQKFRMRGFKVKIGG
jgi:pyruvate formate lyase activating enzyme